MKKRKTSIDFDQVTTRGGDTGDSSIYSGERYRKDDLLFNTLGDVDELSSFLGLVKTHVHNATIVDRISSIQQTLITIGGEIATPKNHALFDRINHITQADIETIEGWEKDLLASTPIESAFVLPGENAVSAYTDVARTVCRRAERKVVACIRDRVMTHLIPTQKYLNRLSDVLFILARALGKDLVT